MRVFLMLVLFHLFSLNSWAKRINPNLSWEYEDPIKVRLCDPVVLSDNPTHLPRDYSHVNCRITGERLGPKGNSVPGSIVVMSWNIERGVQLEAQLALFGKSLPIPDVLLLSEVDRGCRRSGGKNVAREYALQLGMNYVFVPEFLETESVDGRPHYVCEHGNALLSRFSIENVEAFFFKANSMAYLIGGPSSENRLGGRSAVGGKIKIGDQDKAIYVYSTHLESYALYEKYRWQQTKELIKVADPHTHALPVVIGGDFNDFLYSIIEIRSPVSTAMIRAGFDDSHYGLGDRHTIISPRPFIIDFIYSKGLQKIGAGIGPAEDCLKVSDHRAIWAEYALDF